MYGLNEVNLLGTLASEPKISVFDGDKVKAELFIAINEREPRRDESGNTTYQEVSRFTTVEFWGGNARFIRDYTNKGDHVSITGKVNRSSWEDENGQKKSRQYIEGRNITKVGSPRKTDVERAALQLLEKASAEGKSLVELMTTLQAEQAVGSPQ